LPVAAGVEGEAIVKYFLVSSLKFFIIDCVAFYRRSNGVWSFAAISTQSTLCARKESATCHQRIINGGAHHNN
jgi:hypothetical protein